MWREERRAGAASGQNEGRRPERRGRALTQASGRRAARCRHRRGLPWGPGGSEELGVWVRTPRLCNEAGKPQEPRRSLQWTQRKMLEVCCQLPPASRSFRSHRQCWRRTRSPVVSYGVRFPAEPVLSYFFKSYSPNTKECIFLAILKVAFPHVTRAMWLLLRASAHFFFLDR